MTDKSCKKESTSKLPWSVQETKNVFESDGSSATTQPIAKKAMTTQLRVDDKPNSPTSGAQIDNMGGCVSCEDKSNNTRGRTLPNLPDHKELQKGASDVSTAGRGSTDSDVSKCTQTSAEKSPVAPPRHTRQKNKGPSDCKEKALGTARKFFEIEIFRDETKITSINIPCDQPHQWYQWDFIFQNKSKQDLLNEHFRRKFQLKTLCQKAWKYPYRMQLVDSRDSSHWKDEKLLARELNSLCKDVGYSSLKPKREDDWERFESMLQHHCHCKDKNAIWHKGKSKGNGVYILVGYSIKVDEINQELGKFIVKMKDHNEQQKTKQPLADEFLKTEEEEFHNVLESFDTKKSEISAHKTSSKKQTTYISQSGGEALQGSMSVKVKGQNLNVDKNFVEASESAVSPIQTNPLNISSKTTIKSSLAPNTDQVLQETGQSAGAVVDQEHNGAKPKSRNRETKQTGSDTEMMQPTASLDHSSRQQDIWMPPNYDDEMDQEFILPLESLDFALLSKFEIAEQAQKELKQIKCDLSSDKLRITGTDVKKFATLVALRMKTLTDSVVDLREHVSHQLVLDMFKTSKEFAEELVKRKGCSCHLQVLDTEETQIQVYAKPNEMNSVIKALKQVIDCKAYPMDKQWKMFLKYNDVKVKLDALQKKHNGKVCIVKEDKLYVICHCNISKEIYSEIDSMKKNFFVSSAINKITEQGIAEYCEKFLRGEIDKLQKEFEVEIRPLTTDDNYGWTLQGPKGTIERAHQCLCKEIMASVTSKLIITDEAANDFFASKSGQKWIKEVESKNSCIIVRKYQQIPKSGCKKILADNKNQQWTLADGRSVGLYLGDPEQFSCDVVLKTVPDVTKGYSHSAQSSVMYVQSYETSKDKHHLSTTFINILSDFAAKQKLSIAVPVNVGEQIGWKDITFLKVLLHAFVKEFKGEIQECRFIVEKDETWEKMMGVMEDCFNTKEDIEEKTPEQNISVWHGELAQQTNCDVIVNTTSSDLQLQNGAVSSSLLNVAGGEMQREVSQKYPHGVKFGEVAITKGYNLHCKLVFHGALPNYERDKHLQHLRLFMLNCLKAADENGLVSIAFPALGTGNLGYPRDKVAAMMYDTVRYFGKHQPSLVTKVLFVIYQKDKPTQKAFESERRKRYASNTADEDQASQGLHMKYGHSDLWVSQEDVKSVRADGLVLFWYKDEMQSDQTKVIFEAGDSAVTDWMKHSQNLDQPGSEGKVATSPGSLQCDDVLHILCDSKSPRSIVEQTLDYAGRRKMTSLVIVFHEKTDRITQDVVKFAKALHETLTKCQYANLRTLKVLTDTASIKDKLTSELKTLGASNIVEDLPHGDDDTSQQQSVLVVTGHNDDVVKAVGQLKEQIKQQEKEYKAKQPSERTSRGNSVSSDEGARKGADRHMSLQSPDVPQQTVYPCITLSKRRYEMKRLLAYPKDGTFSKSLIQQVKDDLGHDVKTVTSPKADLILIICENHRSADHHLAKFRESNKQKYILQEYPSQTVVNLKARLNPKLVQIVTDSDLWQDFQKMFDGCGVVLNKEGEDRVLEGNLLEIQFAQEYFANMFAEKGLSLEPAEQNNDNTDDHRVRSSKKNISKHPDPNIPGQTGNGSHSTSINNDVDTVLEREKSAFANSQRKSQNMLRMNTTNKGSAKNIHQIRCDKEEFDMIKFHFAQHLQNVTFDEKDGMVCGDTNSFNTARTKMDKYTFDEITGLTDVEIKKYLQMQEIPCEMVCCKHNLKEGKFLLSGEKYADVQEAKSKILLAIGRQKLTNRAFRFDTPKLQAESAVGDIKKHSFRQSTTRSWRPPPDSRVMITKEGVDVIVYQADILCVGVDCVLIATDESLQYSKGITASVLDAAGQDFRTALDKLFSSKTMNNVGDVCPLTAAGSLKCKYVVHMIGPNWEIYKQYKKDGEKMCIDDLQRAFMNSFKQADVLGLTSIAVPAVNSGLLQVRENICLRAVTEAVISFSADISGSSLKYIHFVDRNQDRVTAVRRAFEECCESYYGSETATYQGNYRKYGYTSTTAKGNPVMSPASDDAFSQQGPHADRRLSTATKTENHPNTLQIDESKDYFVPTDARELATYVISKKVTVFIYTGDITKAKCNAIVCPEDEGLHGTNSIAKEIANNAGRRYTKEKAEERNKDLKKHQLGYVITTGAGKLEKIQKVLHVIMPVESRTVMLQAALKQGYMESLGSCISNVFCVVHKQKLESVALPMFGSGIFGSKDREEMAGILKDKILHCSQTLNWTHNLYICIVNKDSTNTNAMISQFKGLKMDRGPWKKQ